MKKVVLAATLAAVAVAVPAQASPPASPGAQGKSHSTKAGSKSKRCTPRSVAYVAFGEYVSGALTQTQGAATTDDASDDRWSGTLVVDVKRTNKHARADKGVATTYTLDDAKLKVATEDRNKDGKVDQADAAAGDRVKLTGKITRRNKKCSSEGFTATKTFRRVTIAAPEQAPAPAPAPAPAS
jgi:hypothetical protein